MPQFIKVANLQHEACACMPQTFWSRIDLASWQAMGISAEQAKSLQAKTVAHRIAQIAQTEEPVERVPKMLLDLFLAPEFSIEKFDPALTKQIRAVNCVAHVALAKHSDLSTVKFTPDEIEVLVEMI